ncbi:MAG TPA: hypothetical protein VES97_04705 [Solirubrobacteraceae bacterium]|nr:hypothetical protein [Solirubrobacteraceae bacterium]
MLHVITVHYRSPQWIEIQTRHLREHIKVPYQTWTSLERIDPSHSVHFDHVFEQRGRHPGKLNHLAIEISHEAPDDDLLMFLDGDAFPIADPMPMIEEGLGRAPLVAVRRAENVEDPQPHPCFCVTTVGTWRSLPGDWSGAYTWTGPKGTRVTDVGGNLLRALQLTGTPWVEVLRSNRRNLDPLFFAVYGDTVYHHGAGFRDGDLSRAHLELAPEPWPLPRVPGLRSLVRRANWQRRQLWVRRTERRYLEQSRVLYEKIQRGGSDWLADLV